MKKRIIAIILGLIMILTAFAVVSIAYSGSTSDSGGATLKATVYTKDSIGENKTGLLVCGSYALPMPNENVNEIDGVLVDKLSNGNIVSGKATEWTISKSSNKYQLKSNNGSYLASLLKNFKYSIYSSSAAGKWIEDSGTLKSNLGVYITFSGTKFIAASKNNGTTLVFYKKVNTTSVNVKDNEVGYSGNVALPNVGTVASPYSVKYRVKGNATWYTKDNATAANGFPVGDPQSTKTYTVEVGLFYTGITNPIDSVDAKVTIVDCRPNVEFNTNPTVDYFKDIKNVSDLNARKKAVILALFKNVDSADVDSIVDKVEIQYYLATEREYLKIDWTKKDFLWDRLTFDFANDSTIADYLRKLNIDVEKFGLHNFGDNTKNNNADSKEYIRVSFSGSDKLKGFDTKYFDITLADKRTVTRLVKSASFPSILLEGTNCETELKKNLSVVYGNEANPNTVDGAAIVFNKTLDSSVPGTIEEIYAGYYGNDTYKPCIVGPFNLLIKAKNTWTTEPSVANVSYGTTVNPVYAAEYGSASITYVGTGDTTYESSATKPTEAGTYQATFTVTGTDAYEGITKTVDFKINKKEVTVSGISAENKTYDGNTDATLDYTGLTVSGLVGNDTITATADGTFDNKNVGTDKTVTISNIVLADVSGKDFLKNYTLAASGSQTEAKAGITAKDITVTITANGGTYAGTITAATAALNDLISGESFTPVLTYTGTANNGTEVDGTDVPTLAGTYTVTATLPADATNYSLTGTTTAEFVVEKASVTAPEIGSKAYTGDTLTADVDCTGKPYEVKTNNGGSSAGTYDVVLTLTDAANYKWSDSDEADTTVTFEITNAENSWTTTPSIADITYGEELSPVYASTFGSASITYEGSGDTNYDSSETEPTDAGTYQATFTVAETDDYEGLTTTVDFTINKKEVTVSGIVAESKTYDGNTDATLDYTGLTITGLVGSETLTATALGDFEDKNVGTDKTVTISNIELSDVSGQDYLKNYTLAASGSQTEATANIIAKDVTVSITANGGTYAGTITAATAALNDLISGESFTPVLTYTGTANNGTEVDGTDVPTLAGTYTVTATLPADATNYSLTGTTTAEFVVEKASVTAPEIGSKAYTGDTLTADVDCTGKPYEVKTNEGGITAGDYDVVLMLTDAANYKWSDSEDEEKTLTFTIIQADNSWETTPSIEDLTYGESIEPQYASKFGDVSITYEGTGETTYDSSETEPTDAGTYQATFTVTETDDYGELTATCDFTINKKEVGLEWSTPEEADLVYDGTAKTVTAEASGLVEDDECEVTVGLTTGDDNINVGEFTFTATELSNSNYKLPENVTSNEYSITARTVTVTSGITATNRDYIPDDNTVTLVVTAAVLDGKVEGDDLSITATGTMADANVGEDKEVTISDIALVGDSKDNYVLAESGNQSTTTVTITNAGQNAPANVTAEDESIKGKSDGKLSGVNDTMEYRKAADTEYTAITGTEVEGLPLGEYKVRYKAKDNYDASPDATVYIGFKRTITVTFDSVGGTAIDPITNLEWEDTVTKPDDPTRDSSTFNGWYFGDKEYDFGTKLTDDITLKAKWTLDDNASGEEIVIGTNGDNTASIQLLAEEGVKASGLENIALALLEEYAGQDVKVTLNASVVTEETEDSEEVQALQNEAGYKNAMFVSIDLLKIVGGNDGENITDTNGNVLEILIPFETDGKNSFEIFSYHDGGVISYTEAQTGEDGTFYIKDNVAHIFTSKFCTFSLAYLYEVVAKTHATLTFKNTTLPRIKVKIGTVVDLSKYVPEKDGATFDGWYSDADLTTAVSEIKIKNNTCVYAKWKDNEESVDNEDCPESVFKDLDLSLWYHDGIHFCVENKLMQGVEADRFNPDGSTTRAMIVTILWRMAGSPEVRSSANFEDVPENEWFTKAVKWAQSSNVVKGYSDEVFGPVDKITREQMATILYRYAVSRGLNVDADKSLSSFSDANKVSDWAEKSMMWAVANGLINGRTAKELAPGGSATRAEVATIIYRFCEMLEN